MLLFLILYWCKLELRFFFIYNLLSIWCTMWLMYWWSIWLILVIVPETNVLVIYFIYQISYTIKSRKKIITWSFVDLFPNTVAATFTTVWIVWAVLITFAAFLKNFLILLQAWTSSVSSKMANEKTKKYRNCTFKKKNLLWILA